MLYRFDDATGAAEKEWVGRETWKQVWGAALEVAA
jgi:hypothetical protein